MIKKTNELNDPNNESAEAILENVFGESLEISPNLTTLPERKKDGQDKPAESKSKPKAAKSKTKTAKMKPKTSKAKPEPAITQEAVDSEFISYPVNNEKADSEESVTRESVAVEVSNVEVSNVEVSNVEVSNVEVADVEVTNDKVTNDKVANDKVANDKVAIVENATDGATDEGAADEGAADEGAADEGAADEGDSFADLPLAPEVQAAIKATGYKSPTPIQAQIIPHLLYGRDVLAQSQTGSGKTAAFALPVLTRLEMECKEPQVLVLVPTRELAIQVGKSFQTYGNQMKDFNLAIIYGGQDYEVQYRQLRKGPQVIVGTPGRVIDHIKNGKLDIGEIECLVLDEADEMLNMGFVDDIEFVLQRAPKERQIALFSATLPEPIRQISKRYLNDPAKVTIKQKTLTADTIRQRAVMTSPRDRVDMLIRFLEAEDADAAIVFTRTRETTSIVADKLVRAGLRACALNGEMQQKARERTIEKLKSGQLDILVATDIAARGLDVARISHVFNFDLPEGPEAYTHRIGRTGRAGKKGEAVIFLTRSQQGKLKFIEKITRQTIEIVEPPTAAEINKMRVKRFYKDIDNTVANRDMHFFEKLVNDFIEQSEHPVEKIAAAIAMIGQKGRDFLMKDRPVRERKESTRGNGRSRGSSGPEPGMARFRIAVGKQDGVRPGNIVGAVTGEGNIDGEDIGSIKIHHSYSTIDLPADREQEILESLAETRVSGRSLHIRRYVEKPGERRAGKDNRNRKSGFGKSKGANSRKGKFSRERGERSGRSGSPTAKNKRNGKRKSRPS